MFKVYLCTSTVAKYMSHGPDFLSLRMMASIRVQILHFLAKQLVSRQGRGEYFYCVKIFPKRAGLSQKIIKCGPECCLRVTSKMCQVGPDLKELRWADRQCNLPVPRAICYVLPDTEGRRLILV